jgi:hypothetical protein
MIGYHYTTRVAWKQIRSEGVEPSQIREKDLTSFRRSLPDLPDVKVVWVWKEELTNEQALIVLVTLAEAHRTFDMVLLELEYEPESSAAIVHAVQGYDARLVVSFDVGRLGTGKLPCDLILDHVPTRCVSKIWEINLLDSLKHRHASEPCLA